VHDYSVSLEIVCVTANVNIGASAIPLIIWWNTSRCA